MFLALFLSKGGEGREGEEEREGGEEKINWRFLLALVARVTGGEKREEDSWLLELFWIRDEEKESRDLS